MSDIDKPEIPEPEKAPAGGDIPTDGASQPHLNGNGGAPIPQQIDTEKLILWMKATDKQIKMLTAGQVAVCIAMLGMIVLVSKGKPPLPTP